MELFWPFAIWGLLWVLASNLLSLKVRSRILSVGGGFLIGAAGMVMIFQIIGSVVAEKTDSIAKKAGFPNFDEYKQASAVGFSTKPAYDDYLAAVQRQRANEQAETRNAKDAANIDFELADRVVLDARSLTYDQLDFDGLDERRRVALTEYCCSYSETGGWRSEHLTRFSPEDGYFVWARINIDALARLTEANQCGTPINPKRCSEVELQERIQELWQQSERYPHNLYGKYKSSWAFYAGGRRLPSTDRYGGHGLLSVKRDWAARTDEILVGPIPQKPNEMEIRIWQEKANGRLDLPHPKVLIE